MQAHRPIIQHHRLQKYVLWVLAMLSWVGAVMLANQPISARHNRQRADVTLARLSRWVANLLMMRALHMLGRKRHRPELWRHNRFQRPSGLRRALLGAKLRRMLNHKDATTNVAQLITVLRNLDHYAAHLAHNVRHRRRLVRVVPPIAANAPLPGAPAPTPAFSDSS